MPLTEIQQPPSNTVRAPDERTARGETCPYDELLHRMAACPPGRQREALREAVIRALLPLARRLARRYGSPIDGQEDLYQVACMGLVKAVNRFDPQQGRAFLPYAVPTIDGELKRYLREHTWGVHVPRRMQEKHSRVRQAQEEMRRAGNARGGSTRDIQRLTGMDEADVQWALRADQARDPMSMDEQRGEHKGTSLAEIVGADDPELERVVDLVALRALLPKLPPRERTILNLYFFGSMSQREVADIVGISQMHVCRLLERSCAFLRRNMLRDDTWTTAP